MPVTSDIVATYRGPRKVMRRLIDLGRREDRALAFVMGFAVIAFVAQLPRLSRVAHLEGSDLSMMMGGALMGTVFILPLMLYVIAVAGQGVARLFGARVTGYNARLALFWSLLATTPVLLFHGLVAGFIGPGPAQFGVGLIWFALFFWFWISGLREAGAEPA